MTGPTGPTIDLQLGVLAETPASAILTPMDAERGAATPAARQVELIAGPASSSTRRAAGVAAPRSASTGVTMAEAGVSASTPSWRSI